jgi:hypothetical protein
MLDKLGILAFKKHIIVVLCFERQDSSNHVQFFACGQETKRLNTRTYIYDEVLVRSLSFIVSNTAHVELLFFLKGYFIDYRHPAILKVIGEKLSFIIGCQITTTAQVHMNTSHKH